MIRAFLSICIATFILFAAGFGTSVAQQSSNSSQTASSTMASTISYQGVIAKDGVAVPDGDYTITTTLYRDAGGASSVWSGTYVVHTANGVFNLLIGSGEYPLPAASKLDGPLFLGVKIGEGAELPLTQLSSALSAMNVSDSSITAKKMGTDYIGSISINGQRFSTRGGDVNIITGDGMLATVDQATNSIVLSATGGSPGLNGKGAEAQTSSYINNSTSKQTSASFNIDGTGVIGGSSGTAQSGYSLTLNSNTSGAAYINGNVKITGTSTLTVGGTSSFSGNAQMNNGLTVSNAPLYSAASSFLGSTTYVHAMSGSGTLLLYGSLDSNGLYPIEQGQSNPYWNGSAGTLENTSIDGYAFGITDNLVGDVNGQYYSNYVTGIQGIPVTANVPSNGQVLAYNSSNGDLEWNTSPVGWSLTGNAGTTPGSDFIGTTDAQNLQFGINNIQAGLIEGDIGTFGNGNVALGYETLLNNAGAGNTALGTASLLNNTTGSANTANGYYALNSNIGGNFNVGNGDFALYSNTTGSGNTAVGGNLTLYHNTTGSNNTVLGTEALEGNTIGSDNTVVGNFGMQSNATGSNNTTLGANADVSQDSLTDATAIGYGAIANDSYNIQLGDSNVTLVSTYGNIATSGTITSGHSLVIDGNAIPRTITGDTTTNFVTTAGNILLTPKQNVGIGKTAPTQTLDVNGAINSDTGYTIGDSAAPDGRFLRSNGKFFVADSIRAADIPPGSPYYLTKEDTTELVVVHTINTDTLVVVRLVADSTIAPSMNNVTSLGDTGHRFHDLYLGSHSLFIGDSASQTTMETNVTGLTIRSVSDTDTAAVVISSTGNLSVPTAVLPSSDTMANLGDTNQRFNTLYLGPNSLVMGNSGAQTSVSTSPAGFSITAASDTDTATVTVSSDGGLSAQSVVASTAVLPMQDTMANLGDSADRFNTLYLGPNSLVMGNSGAQTSVSTSPAGFSITAASDTDTATVTVSSDGSLSADAVVATTAVLPMTDTMANLGDSADRFNTLYLGPNSLVMGNSGAQTSVSTSPAGFSITAASDTDTATVTVSSDGSLSADAVVATTAVLPMTDTMANLGDSADRFNTLYLGPNSLVMGNSGAQTSVSTSSAGFSITAASDTDTATVTVSSDGSLSADAVVATTAVLPMTDTMANLGDSADRFNTLYLGPNSLVMGNSGAQTSVSTSPAGFSITAASDTDTATVTVSPTGVLSTPSLVADDNVTASGPITSGDSIAAAGSITSGNSIIIDGTVTPRLITGDSSLDIATSIGNIVLAPAGRLQIQNLPSSTQTRIVVADASGNLSVNTVSSFGQDYTSSNGITRNDTDFELGGALTQTTDIPLAGYNLSFSGTGNIGIGTSTPTTTLDVVGSEYVSTSIASAGPVSTDYGYEIGGVGPAYLVLSAFGTNNIMVGSGAGSSNSGANNIGMGAFALTNNGTGANNSAVGYEALATNQTTNNNTAIGYRADVSVDGLTNATAIGANAIVNASNTIQLGNANVTLVNTSGAINGASYQIGGAQVLYVDNTNNFNVAVGPQTNTSGSSSTYLGIQIGNATANGSNNVAVGNGIWVGPYAGAGSDNTFVGATAAYNSSGSNNTALGFLAGSQNSGHDNLYLGYYSGHQYSGSSFTAGNYNIYIGEATGTQNTSGSNNTFLGNSADATSSNLTNATAIGNGAVVGASNTIQLGNSSVTLVNTSGALSLGGALNMNSHQINNLTDPTSAQDAATKNYVDTHSGGGNGNSIENQDTTVQTSANFDIDGNGTIGGSLTLGTALGVANGGTGTGTTFDTGSIPFASASGVYSQDNTDLFWDATNKALNIGPGGHGSYGALDVFQTGGDDVVFGGGNVTGSEMKLLSWGFSHISIHNVDGVLHFSNTSNESQTNVVGYDLMTIDGSRTATFPGLVNIESSLDMNATQINNVEDPTNPQDAATKNYVDTHSSGSAWGLTGNSGTTYRTDFIGTTDADLQFQIGGQQAGLIEGVSESDNENTGFGLNVLSNNTSGTQNASFGLNALADNTTGYQNTAMGSTALQDNTTGSGNTAVGSAALVTNTIGSNNTALGSGADVSGVGFSNATAIGANAIVGESNALVLGGTGGNAVKVGIGTTTPAQSLDVVGNIHASGTITSGNSIVIDGTTSTRTITADTALDIISSNGGNIELLPAAGGMVGIGGAPNDAELYIAQQPGFPSLIVNGQDVIGADYPLEINSNTAGQTFGVNTYGRILRLQDINQGTFYDQGIDGNDSWFLDIGNGPEAIVLTASGNVGIGTATPGQEFEIANGNLLISNNTNTSGQLQLEDASSTYVTTFAAGTQSASINYILPVTQGAASTVLTNDGSGNLSWTAGGGGAGWGLTGNSGTNPETNYIGTSDSVDLSFRVDGWAAGVIEVKRNYPNVGFGSGVLANNNPDPNSSANSNAAFGWYALNANTNGGDNTGLGWGALVLNTTGHDNTSTGNSGLSSNTIGFDNTATGSVAMQDNTTGTDNTGIGYSALFTNATSSFNTALGSGADVSTDGLTDATAIGANAIVGASYTVQLGDGNVTNVNTSGSLTSGGNIYLPNSDSKGGVIYMNNVPWWHNYGTNNAFLGLNAGNFTLNTSDATNDVGFGPQTLSNLTTGAQNTAIGGYSLVQPTSGSNNTGVGYNAMNLLQQGNDNTAVGNSAGYAIVNGVQNTFLGSTANASGDVSNATAIGYGATVGGNAAIAMGTNVQAYNQYSIVIGDGVQTNGDGAVAIGTFISNAAGPYSVAIGSSVYTDNNSNYSTAIGFEAETHGMYATSIGYSTSAQGEYSVAMGGASYAEGTYSTALGNSYADVGNTEGYNTALGKSYVTGDYTTAMGWSTAEGNTNTNNLGYSTAAGKSTASGDYSTAMGQSTALADWSTAIGSSTAEPGAIYSTAMGGSFTVGQYATAMGQSNASGNYATAMGYFSLASGDYSVAMGNGANTNSMGGSFVFSDNSGTSTTSSSANQFMARASGGYELFDDASATPGMTVSDTLAPTVLGAGTVTAGYFIGDGSQLTNVPTGVLALPYYNEVSDTNLFHIDNSGGGNAIVGENTSGFNNGNGVVGQASSQNGSGVFANNTANGSGLTAESFDGAAITAYAVDDGGTNDAIDATAEGSGDAIHAFASGGNVFRGDDGNIVLNFGNIFASNETSSDVIQGTNSGSGNGLEGDAGNGGDGVYGNASNIGGINGVHGVGAGNGTVGVLAENSGLGDAMEALAYGNGNAVNAQAGAGSAVTANSNGSYTIFGNNQGNGIAVLGETFGSGTGVSANNYGSGTGLIASASNGDAIDATSTGGYALNATGNIILNAPSQLQFQDFSSTWVTTFATGTQSATINYILPLAQGAASTVLTNDGSGNLSWTAAGGFSLPYSATQAQASGPLFEIGNSGSGNGIEGDANGGTGVLGTTAQSGTGVWGEDVSSPTGGIGVYGSSTDGVAVEGYTSNGIAGVEAYSYGSGSAMIAQNDGTGPGISASAQAGDAIDATGNGNHIALNATATDGRAIEAFSDNNLAILATSSNYNAFQAQSSAALGLAIFGYGYNGVQGESSGDGYGVFGATSGAGSGVQALNSGPGPGLTSVAQNAGDAIDAYDYGTGAAISATSASGDVIDAYTTGNGAGLNISAVGDGDGIDAIAYGNGTGLNVAAHGNGDGIDAHATNNSNGVNSTIDDNGSSNSIALQATNQGLGRAITANSQNGDALDAVSGSGYYTIYAENNNPGSPQGVISAYADYAGDAIDAEVAAGSGIGLLISNYGSGDVIHAEANGTGAGITVTASSGDALNATGNVVLSETGGTASQLQFQDVAGNYTSTFAAGDQSVYGANINYVLPIAQGAAGYVLTNSDGAGTLTWGPASGVPGWALGGNASPNPNIFGTTDATDVVLEAGGITVATLTQSGVIDLPPTVPFQGGYITQGTNLFIHSYQSGFFAGTFAGNLIMTGTSNVGVGPYTLSQNGSGEYNTAVGSQTLSNNTSGSENTAIGLLAMANYSTASYNTAVGRSALSGDINNISGNTGEGNTAIGWGSLSSNTSGSGNTALGGNTLAVNTTGFENTAVGDNALGILLNGSFNSGFGYGTIAAGATNSTAIGAYAYANASNTMVLGSISGVNGAAVSTNIGIGTTAPSTALVVIGTLTDSSVDGDAFDATVTAGGTGISVVTVDGDAIDASTTGNGAGITVTTSGGGDAMDVTSTGGNDQTMTITNAGPTGGALSVNTDVTGNSAVLITSATGGGDDINSNAMDVRGNVLIESTDATPSSLSVSGNISESGENVDLSGGSLTLDGNSNIYELLSASGSVTVTLPATTTSQTINVLNSSGHDQTVGGQTVTNGNGITFIYFPTFGWKKTGTF